MGVQIQVEAAIGVDVVVHQQAQCDQISCPGCWSLWDGKSAFVRGLRGLKQEVIF